MTPALQTLILILLGLGVMLGLVRPKRIGTFLAGLILGPLLAEVIFSFGNQIFLSLTVLQQALFLVLVFSGRRHCFAAFRSAQRSLGESDRRFGL